MATAVVNEDKSLMEHLTAAKSALATADMHGQVLAATFPDTFLAGCTWINSVLLGKYSVAPPLITLTPWKPFRTISHLP